LPLKKEQIKELEASAANPEFWNNRDKALAITQEIASLKKTCESYEKIQSDAEDTIELMELAEADEDMQMFNQLLSHLNEIEVSLDDLELTSFLSEPYDKSDAYLSIKPGAGGTESTDWASMLYRMYCRYLEQSPFKFEVIDLQEEENGIKGATLRIKGEYAYGYMKGEKGVHRLVRISPFDSNARRHTSFTAVDVMPILPEGIEIEVKPDDIKMDFFRSSGAGGQHVNKTSSAVRITHLPTGIVTSSQVERSQHQNREIAINMLKAKLFEIQRQEKEQELKNLQGDQKHIAWGSQIRSYVFCPYTMVKDLRTGCTTSDVHKVMDGALEPFIKSYLNWHANGEKPMNVTDAD